MLAALPRVFLWCIPRLSRTLLLSIAGTSLLSEVISGIGELDFVAHFAHVGGMVGGLWFSLAYYVSNYYEKAKFKRNAGLIG